MEESLMDSSLLSLKAEVLRRKDVALKARQTLNSDYDYSSATPINLKEYPSDSVKNRKIGKISSNKEKTDVELEVLRMRIMQEKTELYNKMLEGSIDPETDRLADENLMVDFERKGWDSETLILDPRETKLYLKSLNLRFESLLELVERIYGKNPHKKPPGRQIKDVKKPDDGELTEYIDSFGRSRMVTKTQKEILIAEDLL